MIIIKKQKFYRLDDINKTGAQYQILLGERSNGKSFAVKEKILYESYHEKDFFTGEKLTQFQFAYVRRWDRDFTGGGYLDYFSDFIADENGENHLYKLTNGEYETVEYYRGKYYFANYDENGKTIKGKQIGFCFAVSMESRYKSRSYPLVKNIVYEEFITDSGYLPQEPKKFTNLISTIIRRRAGTVYLVGNTITRACPYFSHWGLTGTLKQKQGTIIVYDFLTDQKNEDNEPVIIKIAVEMCENSGNNSKMFFGTSSKMITAGGWQTEEQPLLPEKIEKYNKVYQCFIDFDSICYRLQLLSDKKTNEPFIYITPHTTAVRDNERIITDKFSLKPNITNNFTKYYKYDKIIVRLLQSKKMVFSDNLTGTEFKLLLKNKCFT